MAKKKTRESRPARSVKNLPVKTLNAKAAKGVTGGSPSVKQTSKKTGDGKGIEVNDYGFGVSNPVTTG
jgi:hypothetical protein